MKQSLAEASDITLRGKLNRRLPPDLQAFAMEIELQAARRGIRNQGAIDFSKLPIEKGGRGIGRFHYSLGSFRHFDDIVPKGINKGRLERPFMRSLQTIEEIMKTSPPISDPRGTPGLLWWSVPGKFRGSNGQWEILLNPKNNVIYHFNFKS